VEVIPQQYPLRCAQIDGHWIKSGRIVGWEYHPEQPGPARLKPIIAWIAQDCLAIGAQQASARLAAPLPRAGTPEKTSPRTGTGRAD
jgi:hypothetical protein